MPNGVPVATVALNGAKNAAILAIQILGCSNEKIRNDILKSYDLFLNIKYNIDINQVAINNVKNLFQ